MNISKTISQSYHGWLGTMIAGLLVLTFATALNADEASEKLLADSQGTWVRVEDKDGSRLVTLKVIDGNNETVSYYRDGKLTSAHKVELKVESTDHIALFSFKNGESIAGPNKGDKFTGSTYAFKIENDTWYEVFRILNGSSGKPNVQQYKRMSPEDAKAEIAKASTSDNKDLSGFAQSGPDVQLIKKAIHSYAKGDIDTWHSLFDEKATYSHNAWGSRKPIAELADTHREHHAQLAGEVKILKEIYEVVTVKGGGKHGHAWINMEHNFKDGEKLNISVFVAFGINKERKLGYEWAFFDTAAMPEQAAYKAAAN